MFASRLVNLIETHADKLADSLARKIENNEALEDYRKLSPQEVRQHAFEIYRHLSDWLLSRTDSQIAVRFQELGTRRAMQGVALSSLLLALHVTKEHLWEFIQREGQVDRHVELCDEVDLMQRVEFFFDRATYFAACAYEKRRGRAA